MQYIPNQDVPLYFRAADIAVLPYRKIYSSGVLLRALDYGTPVVASDLAPLTSIIRDGVNGRVFETESPESLARVILEIIGDDTVLADLSAKGKETIEIQYSWKIVAQETMKVYRQLSKQ
jgi:glycosyltransferase involved in cell wall biosynthesis